MSIRADHAEPFPPHVQASPVGDGALRVERGGARGARLLLEDACRAGRLLYRITDHTVAPRPTVYSIQIGPQAHVGGEALGPLAFLNHACDPSAVFDAEALTLRARRDLAAGDELTFFYPSTEWDMDHPFACRCGAPQCVRVVAGAKYLSADVLGRYFVNPHVRALLLAAVSATPPVPAMDAEAALPLDEGGVRR